MTQQQDYLPPRTSILRCPPKAIGTSNAESLVSLIARTAYENGVTVAKFFNSKVRCESVRTTAVFSIGSLRQTVATTIDGCSPATEAIVARMESLTGYSDLRACTALAFEPIAGCNGLLRSSGAICAKYLREVPTSFYPLLWHLEAIRVCPTTRMPLRSICPFCERTLRPLTTSISIGKCPTCHRDLRMVSRKGPVRDPLAEAITDFEYEIWVSEQVGEYIANSLSFPFPADYSFENSLRFWMRQFGLCWNEECARKIGAFKPALGNWLNSGQKPRLRMVLSLCWVFGASLTDFLLCRVPTRHPGVLRSPPEARKKSRIVMRPQKPNLSALERRLNDILKKKLFPLQSFESICARILRLNKRLIRRHFPDQAKQISNRYLANRAVWIERNRAMYVKSLKDFARQLHQIGIAANAYNLSRFEMLKGRIRASFALKAIREVRIELGYYSNARQLELPIGN